MYTEIVLIPPFLLPLYRAGPPFGLLQGDLVDRGKALPTALQGELDVLCLEADYLVDLLHLTCSERVVDGAEALACEGGGLK